MFIGTNIEEFIKKGDRVAIAGISESNAALISDIARKYNVDIVGGYTKDIPGQKINIERKSLPVFAAFSELMEGVEKSRQPNKIAICLPPADIYEEIKEIRKYGCNIIDTVLIVPRVSSTAEVEKINRICRQANFNLFINFTPFDWEQIYGQGNLEDIGWYIKGLDPDLDESLRKNNITGGTFLDLGTGPGTQAIELAKRGFSVTATDISEAAIQKIRELSDAVEFLVDDILNTRLNRKFDYIFDRGCFHSIAPSDRSIFIKQICRLLNEDGVFFLKCFSEKMRWFSGPYRFSTANIKTIFSEYFKIIEIKDTEFYGLSQQPLAALFVMMYHK